LEELGVNGRELKTYSEEMGWKVYSGLDWPKIETTGGLLWKIK
jgi:hypothetical protein